jgi:hypothetical protein
MALLVGSPAIDAGDNTYAPQFDQRGAPRVVNGTIDIGAYEVQAAPVLECTVARPLLWPASGRRVNVGLDVGLNADADPSARVRLQVYGNDGAVPSDAAHIGPGTLKLRALRQPHQFGRVYLIVATATDASGQTGEATCTVVVPLHDNAPAIRLVQLEASLAQDWYARFHSAPSDYQLLRGSPPPQPAPRPATLRPWTSLATATPAFLLYPAAVEAVLPGPRLDSVAPASPSDAQGSGASAGASAARRVALVSAPVPAPGAPALALLPWWQDNEPAMARLGQLVLSPRGDRLFA